LVGRGREGGLSVPAAATKLLLKGKFKTRLAMPGQGSWCYLKVTGSAARFGTRARIAVQGTINGHRFRSSLQPDGRGNHAMMVNKLMQQGGGFKPGATVRLVLTRDTASRTVAPPPLLRRALAANRKARDFYAGLAPSHQKAYVVYVMGAKQEETRRRRARKTVQMLAAGRKMD
jgi:bacteriocin resistance YdeI/OmpD-like protein/uncharacterized protein DUF1905